MKHRLILAPALVALSACTTTEKKPDGTVTVEQVDSKLVRQTSQTAIELLKLYLGVRTPAYMETLYDGPRVILSEVPR